MEGTGLSIFGAITIGTQLEQAVVDTLGLWFPTYLKEYELQAGLIAHNTDVCKHPLPKRIVKADRLDKTIADLLPAIVVVSPGLSGKTLPKQEGDGSMRVFFSIAAGVFVSARTRDETMEAVRVYTAIARTILLQKQSLGGFADGSVWLDESYDDNFPFADRQTISAGQVVFEIEVSGLVNRFDGPKTAEPVSSQPGSDWPLAEQVMATVERKDD